MHSPSPPNLSQQRQLQISYLDHRINPQTEVQEKTEDAIFLQILTVTDPIFLKIVKVE